ncbi:hypothetical protein ACFY0F_07695 [Streptomyces sp. NPDC001544]|uniref:hypothetical protein n=1 Tax=Streptomyces sp. NPDC001544 TaxID=3364584 RepID=UPI0036B9DF25
MTYTHIWTAGHCRPEPDRVSRERLSRGAASSEERGGPTDAQVWNWAESALLSGYGPAASSFV